MTTASLPRTADRDPYWDNAKAILVTLVVVGHALQPLAASGIAVADVLYRWIYLFHMPAFVFVAGILTAEMTTKRAGRLVTGLLVPYVIFQAIQTVEVSLLQGHRAPLHLLVPRWTLWFLVALVLWRLAAPVFLALRPWVAMTIAVSLCVLAGLSAGVGHALALDDALGFLPFFVAGLLVRTHSGVRPIAGARWLAAFVLVAALACAALTRDQFSRSALQLGFSADSVGATDARASLLRLALLAAAGVATWGVLVLVPRRGYTWTTVGRASMYVYVLHPLVLLPFRPHGAVSWAGDTPRVALVALGAGALAVCLATTIVRRGTRWAVEPEWASALLATSSRHRSGRV